VANLLASLNTSGSALEAFQRSLDVIQNNINNASTPGYAKQRTNLEARSFDVAGGLTGGVAAQGLADSRDELAESEVRRQLSSLGTLSGRAEAVEQVERLFDVSGKSGISAALNELFASFSAWSASPNSATARQAVLDRASDMAAQIQSLAGSIEQASQGLDSQIGSTVERINGLAEVVRQYNVERLRHSTPDPGQDAKLNATLDELAELTSFTPLRQTDGSVTLITTRGTPLVMGREVFPLSFGLSLGAAPANPQAPPSAVIVNSDGQDVTADIAGGYLAGLLDARNRVVGSITGSADEAGSLNVLAKTLADTVNQVLQAGTVSNEPGAAAGGPLFAYDASDPTLAARSIRLDSNATAASLAAADSAGTANGTAISLAALGDSTSELGRVDGLGLVQYFSAIAAFAGGELSSAQSAKEVQTQVAAQASTLRDQTSGVSLDEQAVQLLEFQRCYEATARVLTVLNDLTETTLNLLR
jgi:flagellar hook-associated protein 1